MTDMKLVVAIINFLKEECQKTVITDDTRESLEVAIQCLQTAYDLKVEDLTSPKLQTSCSLVEMFKMAEKTEPSVACEEIPPEIRAEAEKCKNLGNSLMKSERHAEAVEAYSEAISLDGHNAVYYCNRAAAYSRVSDYQAAIKDCGQAILLDPKYSKAYGRMGLAYASLGNNAKAIECYKKAIELDPSNESYRNNLKLAEEKASKEQQSANSGFPGGSPVDVNALLNNPVLRNMATTMMQDPNMFNILSGFVSSSMNESGNVGNVDMDALLQAGQQFAAQMQASNPEFIQQLRQQVLGSQNAQNSDNKDSSSH